MSKIYIIYVFSKIYIIYFKYIKYLSYKPKPKSLGFPGSSAGKELTYNEGNLGSIPGLGAWQPNSSILAWRIPKDRVTW